MKLRSLLAGASTGALVAGLTALAPAADAAVLSSATLTLSGSPSASSTCPLTGTPSQVTTGFADGQSVTRTLSYTATATNTGDGTDTATIKGTAKATVHSAVSGGVLHSLTLDTQQSSTVSAAKGGASQCHGTLGNALQTTTGATFAQSHPMWMRFDASTAGTGAQTMIAEVMPSGASGVDGIITVSGSIRGHRDSQWVYLPAGSYALQVGLASQLDDGTFPGLASASMTGHLGLTFVPAGSAAGPATGAARADVRLPGRIACSTGKATVTLTSAVKGASSVVLSANGVRRRSVSRPAAGKVVVTGLPTDRDVTLKAVVRTGGRSLTVSRAYRAC
jgi:hypothetical protein